MCDICSNKFFSTIFEAALKKDEEFITEALKVKRQSRINYILEKIPDFILNFKFKQDEIELCKHKLEAYGFESYAYFDEDVKNIIAMKDYLLLQYYLKETIRHDLFTSDFAVREAKKERERRSEKFLKFFLKQNRQFKIQKERKGSDCVVFFNPFFPSNKSIYLNEESNENLNEMIELWKHKIYFFKNKNTHDSKRVVYSQIRNAVPAPKGVSIKNHY